MALTAATLLFVSLLLHELGHALQARREGMEIDGITLWLFGGVATFRGTFPGPGAEFRIAGAGPLVSLALGVLFAGFATVADLPVAVDGVASWLGYINLSLLLFNLLPALPLDGGRILRAALWRLRRDFAWATRIAAEAGRATGFLLMAAGFVLFLLGGMFGGAWIAFLGWFVLSAAGSEARYAETRAAISGLRVRDLMAPDPATARRADSLAEFMDSIGAEHRFTSYPVLDGGSGGRAVADACGARDAAAGLETLRVGDRMLGLEQAPRLAPEDELYDALARLAEAGVKRGLVLDGDRLAGYLSVADVADALTRR